MFRPDAFREAALTGPRLSLADLLALHGRDSPAVLLLVLSLMCVTPLYGVGTALSLAILAIGWRWRRITADDAGGRTGPPLPDRLGRITLDETWSRRCLHGLAWLYETSGRRLRERWSALAHPRTGPWWGLWIASMAVLIFLPVPFGNVLPSLSLVLLSLGWMFRDGIALLASALVGSSAIAVTVALSHTVIALAESAWTRVAGLGLLQ